MAPVRQRGGAKVKVNIYGLGYVGSVSAACLAADGHEVLGLDIDQTKVDSINRGLSPVVEPGLSELIKAGVTSHKLRASTATTEDSDISLVCVGTPSNENGSLRLNHISRATEQIAEF